MNIGTFASEGSYENVEGELGNPGRVRGKGKKGLLSLWSYEHGEIYTNVSVFDMLGEEYKSA